MRRRAKFIGFLIVIVWLFVIFAFSAMNANTSSSITKVAISFLDSLREDSKFIDLILTKLTQEHSIVYVVRKLAHITVFFVLELVVYSFLRIVFRFNVTKALIFSAGFSILYAFTDEFHQLFVSGRSAEFKDVFIDSIGVTLGVSLIILERIAMRIFIFLFKYVAIFLSKIIKNLEND
jgi:VanZ family protein